MNACKFYARTTSRAGWGTARTQQPNFLPVSLSSCRLGQVFSSLRIEYPRVLGGFGRVACSIVSSRAGVCDMWGVILATRVLAAQLDSDRRQRLAMHSRRQGRCVLTASIASNATAIVFGRALSHLVHYQDELARVAGELTWNVGMPMGRRMGAARTTCHD